MSKMVEPGKNREGIGTQATHTLSMREKHLRFKKKKKKKDGQREGGKA